MKLFSSILGAIKDSVGFIKTGLAKIFGKKPPAKQPGEPTYKNLLAVRALISNLEKWAESYSWGYQIKTAEGQADFFEDHEIVKDDAQKIINAINQSGTANQWSDDWSGRVLKAISDTSSGMTGRDLSKWLLDLVYALYSDRYRPQPYSKLRTSKQTSLMSSIVEAIKATS